ncbi:DNA glycosylase [Methanobrevibacter filiformis]|uniref:DNA-(apurinic or apyrimidinic site) lyase n=1 Tax=Methanobrevibacter filiformis TaxID=55758 RepID=A0A162FFZ5_9EURY|nr:DNA glycosylase [Methanobrevibacter filiformis]KZX12495.1 endonuclease III [Methanobrevibacter filiformis]
MKLNSNHNSNHNSKHNFKLNSKINLKLTEESGQTSQPPWKLVDNSYYSLIKTDKTPILLKISQQDINSLDVDWELPINYDGNINEIAIKKEVNRIFDLDFDLDKFYKYLHNNCELAPSLDFCKGLRLFIARDPFECIISSISSANNSIARWTKSVNKISNIWGKTYKFSSGNFNDFPSPAALKDVYEDNLIESAATSNENIEGCISNLKYCGLGYRSSYIKKTSEVLTLEMDLSEISKMTYNEAFDTIISLPGVGPKVADCILLYGFNMGEAFPSDVWIKRIISYLYFDGKDITANKVRSFGMETFGEYAGYVQLYLFHYARKSGLMDKLRK